jgi:hypothetical protein
MKRSPLKRKTPLKAKPGARLAPASTKQADRLARYNEMLLNWQGKWACAKCGHKTGLEPHHPWGRGRENLFRVILLCHTCHEGCHAQPDLAFELGWLQCSYRGIPEKPNHPIPWHPASLITDTQTP